MAQLADADGMAWWNEKGGVSLERSAKCVDRVLTKIDNASAEKKSWSLSQLTIRNAIMVRQKEKKKQAN